MQSVKSVAKNRPNAQKTMALKKRVKPKQATQQRQLSRTNPRPGKLTERMLASHPKPRILSLCLYRTYNKDTPFVRNGRMAQSGLKSTKAFAHFSRCVRLVMSISDRLVSKRGSHLEFV